MDLRLGLVFLLVLSGNYWACEARNSIRSDASSGSTEVGKVEETKSADCILCIEYATLVANYVAENMTETEILDALHYDCTQSQTSAYELMRCFTLVDTYAKVYMEKYTTVEPEAFCEEIKLCEETTAKSSSSCDVCHQTVNEILLNLKNPNSKLDIIEEILKVCDAAENSSKKCKSLVAKHRPVILVNPAKYLHKNDLCAACSVDAESN